MNIKLILAVLAGVIAISVGAYFIINNGDATKPVVSEENKEESSLSGEFRQIVRSGKAFECTLSYDDGINASNGVVYITAGADRIRGDINVTKSPAGAMQVHILRDDGYNYVWSSMMSGGIKTAVEDKESLFEQDENSPIDPNTAKFDCHTWRVDDSKFALPADVEFQDMSSMMSGTEASVDASVSAHYSQCAACDMIPDQRAAEQCRTALNCQ